MALALLTITNFLWHHLIQIFEAVRYTQFCLKPGPFDSFGICCCIGTSLTDTVLATNHALGKTLAVQLQTSNFLAFTPSPRFLAQGEVVLDVLGGSGVADGVLDDGFIG